MEKRIIGINCTASGIFAAIVKRTAFDFEIVSTDKLAYSIEGPEQLRILHHAVSALLSGAKSSGVRKLAVLKCSAGMRGSSVESIKAEGIVELVATSELGMDLQRVTPQSLPKALEANGKKWQVRAKELFNADGNIKYWANATDGAVAAAYKVVS